MSFCKKLFCVLVTSAAALSAHGQSNIIGYYLFTLFPGDNLIANQFDNDHGNTLDTLFPDGNVLAGSTFTKWSPSKNELLPLSIFDGTSWSINYHLSPNGVGGVLNSPATTTTVFVGDLPNYDLNTGYTFVPPVRGPGTYLLSLATALPNETFEEIVGREPIIGDLVKTLDASNQTYTTTTFDGTSWDNGTPSLGLGQAAYFGLAEVPEPSTVALIGLSAVIIAWARRAPGGRSSR